MQEQKKTKQNGDEVQFRHLRHKQGKREMAVTVAYARKMLGNGTIHGIALAFCCPKDQFSKSMGRCISSGRLASALKRFPNSGDKDVRFALLIATPPEALDTLLGIDYLLNKYLPRMEGPPWWVHTLMPAVMERLAEAEGEGDA